MKSCEREYRCNDTAVISRIGANAYSCDMPTNLTTRRGYYNVTMIANTSAHYENKSISTDLPGLFYLFPKYKIDSTGAAPTSAGWGYPNWNFTVVTSSGDPDTVQNVSLLMGTSFPPTTECTSPTCINKTSITNNNAIRQNTSWHRNFTNSQIGTWYYKYTFATASTTDVLSVTVTKDFTNISYGDSGNDSEVTKDTTPALLIVRVYDNDSQSYNTTPVASVNFRLLDPSYTGGERLIGTNTTNSSGYAEFNFNATDCNYKVGSQSWGAYINGSDSNYNQSNSPNFTLSIVLSGCNASIDVVSPLSVPTEVFQYRYFRVNATINAFVSTANNVNVNLSTPGAWTVIENKTQFFATVGVGSNRGINWSSINATTYGDHNVTVIANSTDAAENKTTPKKI